MKYLGFVFLAISSLCLQGHSTGISSRELADFDAIVEAAFNGERLSLSIDNSQCEGLDLPMLAAAVMDLELFRIDYSDDGQPMSLSTATNFLAGATVPDNPFVLVPLDIVIYASNEVGILFADIDIKDNWNVLGTLSGGCSLNAGVKVFSNSDPDQPPEVLETYDDVLEAFMNQGRPLSGMVRLKECTGGEMLNDTILAFQSAKLGMANTGFGTAMIDVPSLIVPTGPNEFGELVSQVLLGWDSVEVFALTRNPATWEVLSVDASVSCQLGTSATFFAGPRAEPGSPLLSDFTEIRDSFLAGNQMSLRLDVPSCEFDAGAGSEVEETEILVAGPIPWEYIIIPSGNRIIFSYEASVLNNAGEVEGTRVNNLLFQVYEDGHVNLTHFKHDRFTGELLGSWQFVCQLDGEGSGFSVVRSNQEQLTDYDSIVNTVLAGKTFSSVTDLNFCELPPLFEYGAIGSLYGANFVLVDESGPVPAEYLFSPMSGMEPLAAFKPAEKPDGLGMHDLPLYVFSVRDVLLSERYFDVISFENIKDDFLFVCNLNVGVVGSGSVSVYA